MTHDDDRPVSPHAHTVDAGSGDVAGAAKDPQDPLVGASLGHYRILGRLGQGGMGVVYRAEDEKLRRIVALKVLPDASGNEERRQRFLREARSAAAVTHPNVGVIHQVDDDGGRVYIAMELVEGETLRARLDRGRMDQEVAKDLAAQIARGLTAAHDKGIVHRDLKPENVMITPAGVVKLLDFGLAKVGSEGPKSRKTEAELARTETLVTSDEGRIMGTPEYMSPEQAIGEPLDVRSDVFSFGVVFYEMLSGARPFHGTTTGAILVAVARDAAPPLRERAPDVDEATLAVVMRCLAKAPTERFADAGAIVAALGGATTTTKSSAGVTAPAQSRASAPRSRALPVAAAVAAIAVVGAVAGKGLLARRDEPGAASATPRCTADAWRLYEQGVEAWETQSPPTGDELWSRATKADPDCAPAYLRLALDVGISQIPLGKARAFYAAASDHRDHLAPSEAGLLDALAPVFAPQPDLSRTCEGLVTLAARFPDEALIAYFHGVGALTLDRPDEARAAFERAVALQSRFGPAYVYLFQTADAGDARKAYADRCLAAVPRQAVCALSRGNELLLGSDCAALERFGQQLVATNPGRDSYAWLARGLLANGAPSEAIDAVVQQVKVADEAQGELSSNGGDWLPLALTSEALWGDYDALEKNLRASPMATATDFYNRAVWAVSLALVLDDEGRAPEGDAVVRQTLAAEKAFTPASYPAVLARFFARAIDAGALTRAQVEARFAAAPPPVAAANVFYAWTPRLPLVRTPPEARDVLAAMPAAPDDWTGVNSHYDRARVRALAGDFAGARADLESSLKRCDLIAWDVTFPRVYLLLGQARERTGDVEGARQAYETIVQRWGRLKPRAVHAEQARARLAALAGR